jgi:hypothetical protein
LFASSANTMASTDEAVGRYRMWVELEHFTADDSTGFSFRDQRWKFCGDWQRAQWIMWLATSRQRFGECDWHHWNGEHLESGGRDVAVWCTEEAHGWGLHPKHEL